VPYRLAIGIVCEYNGRRDSISGLFLFIATTLEIVTLS
jgi:hypothetical protein